MIFKVRWIDIFTELEFLVTAPTYQRRGVASLLFNNGMKQVQKLGLNVIVMSTAAGLPFYLSRGFRVVRSITQDFSKHGTDNPRTVGFLLKEADKDNEVEPASHP
jgi:GNAT superfamily N-acetyltransferase